jgi:MFS family permease
VTRWHRQSGHDSSDASLILLGRAIRGFADGFVSIILAQYLTRIGFSPLEVGAIVTGTLLGSAVLTLVFGFSSHRLGLRSLLLAAAAMMVLTGIGFAGVTWFWPLFAIAFVGTLNPTAGDVSVFLPTEQALAAGTVDDSRRVRLFATYNLVGIFAGALGALVSGAPQLLARQLGWSITALERGGFLLYALAGLVIALLYRRLTNPSRPLSRPERTEVRRVWTSRRTVLELAALFSLDSAGSGFVVTSLLVLWLHLRFSLSAGTTATLFFASGLLGACSQLLAPRLAARFGLIRTMAFTHLPANAALILAAFAPNRGVVITLLLVRSLFAQMDVPARQAFVMAIVPADERASASSVTNVPRSLASAATPLAAGLLLANSTFGWPLVIAGTVKLTYDLLLLALYRRVPETVGGSRLRRLARPPQSGDHRTDRDGDQQPGDPNEPAAHDV